MSNPNQDFAILQLPGEPIVVVSIYPSYDFATTPAEANKVILPLLETLKQPVFWIVDFNPFLSSGKSISIEPLIIAANKALEAFVHPNIRQTLFVADSRLLELAAQGFKSDPFGNLDIGVFTTLDDALTYTRSQF